jgi:membrane protein YqaA with SNARE-associated domain
MTQEPTAKNGRRTTILRILALLAVVGMIVALFVFRDHLRELQRYGYAGIFLLSIAANSTIIIPVPAAALTTAMGAVFNPIGVAVAAGLGAAIGEMSGYLAGYSGGAVVEHIKYYDQLTVWMRQHPNLTELTIAVLAFIPNPLFDMAGIAAGALKMPVWRFMLPCAIGKILKMLMFAYAGSFGAGWLLQ